MPGPSRELVLRLYRDALSTPWGFRLQGGKDVKLSLTVVKVNVGSPVDGELRRGDILLEIQNCDATQMTHQKAQEMIKNSGGSLLVRVKRLAYQEPQPVPGEPRQQGFMMHRVQDTLTNLRFDPYASDTYTPPTGGHLFKIQQQQLSYRPMEHQQYPRPQFTSNAPPKHSKYPDRMYSTLPRPKNTPQLPTGLSEPGWVPKMATTSQQRISSFSARRPTPPSAPVQPPPGLVIRPRSLEPERPAWEGSLRPFNNPRSTDMRLQEVGHQTQIAHFSPAGSAGGQSSPWTQDSETARIASLQYNSPLALYSRSAAEESLRGQTSGKSPFGSAQARSEVYSIVHEYDKQSRGSRMNQSFENSQLNDMFTDF